MTRLATLRTHLGTLRRTRQRVRRASAWSAMGTAVLAALAGVLVLDYVFSLTVLPRLVVMVLAATALVWAYFKYTHPLLGVDESDLDMALLVERQQGIDSDLVAALQFEAPQAAGWGSRQLETAVIDYVAEFGNGLNVFEGFSREQMTRRLGMLALCAAASAAFVVLAPQTARVFANHLLLGSEHYPGRTSIEQVIVNDSIVLTKAEQNTQPQATKGAQGRGVLFYAKVSGLQPETGSVRVRGAAGARGREIEMRRLTLDERAARLRAAQDKIATAIERAEVDVRGPWQQEVRSLLALDASDAAEGVAAVADNRDALKELDARLKQRLADWPGEAEGTSVYVGDMGRLVEEVRYGVSIGDAWTDPAVVRMTPLPVVELTPHVEPPAYARRVAGAKGINSRQFSVLEGSHVRLVLASVNRKPLKEAWLTTKSGEKVDRVALVKTDAEGLQWEAPATAAALHPVKAEVRYEIQVIDQDDLSLETPLAGAIRILTDRPPSAVASNVNRVVLPTASPKIDYRVSDDFGIASMTLKIAVERGAQSPDAASAPEPSQSTTPGAPEEAETAIRMIRAKTQAPLMADQLPHLGSYQLELAPLQLIKGDRIKVTLEVTDYRGSAPGQTYLADSLVMEISDDSGVLAAISEADGRLEENLTDVINTQTGTGDSP